MDTWLWIVIVVVALLIIGALVAFSLRKKREVDGERAASIRAEAALQAPELRRREAEAQGAEAEAARMRAEADQLEQIAAEEREQVQEDQSGLDERLRTADRLDPETETPRSTSG